jgi:hypothetical protein
MNVWRNMTDRAVVVSAGEIDRVHRDQKVSVHESLVPAEPLSFCLPTGAILLPAPSAGSIL